MADSEDDPPTGATERPLAAHGGKGGAEGRGSGASLTRSWTESEAGLGPHPSAARIAQPSRPDED